MKIASLPMYYIPEVRAAQDELWAFMAGNLRQRNVSDVPDRLTHDEPVFDLWRDQNLLFSQCCGYDVVKSFKGQLRPIATPIYSSPFCLGHNYRSLVVVPDDSPYNDVSQMRGAVGVINGRESHSGMNSLRHLISRTHTGGNFFSELKISGGHVTSLELVRNRQADVAAIDCVILALLERYRPDVMQGLRVLGTTYEAPAPPFVVRADTPDGEVEKILLALLETFADTATVNCRKDMLLEGLIPSTIDDYRIINAFEKFATKRNFKMVNQPSNCRIPELRF